MVLLKPSPSHPYQGLHAAIATMHAKEMAIAPVLSKCFGISVTRATDVDTDSLGTFSGEVERKGTMADAARAKALLAIERTGAALGIGSEGAFGPHPYLPFVASGQEVLLLHYAASRHEIITHRHTSTNFDHFVLASSDDPEPFLKRIGFPGHAVLIRPEQTHNTSCIVKGLADYDAVRQAMQSVAARTGSERVMLQTDMRAHLNPTRMKAIARTAKWLALSLARCCAKCGIPGFGITDVQRGLRCRSCGMPTDLICAEIHSCKSCGHSIRKFERSTKQRADPQWCQFCNP